VLFLFVPFTLHLKSLLYIDRRPVLHYYRCEFDLELWFQALLSASCDEEEEACLARVMKAPFSWRQYA